MYLLLVEKENRKNALIYSDITMVCCLDYLYEINTIIIIYEDSH